MDAPQAACKTTCLRRRKRQAMLRSAPIIHRLPKLRHRLPATLETLGSYLTPLRRNLLQLNKLIIRLRHSRLWASATEALPETGEISINGPDAAHRHMSDSESPWAKSRFLAKLSGDLLECFVWKKNHVENDPNCIIIRWMAFEARFVQSGVGSIPRGMKVHFFILRSRPATG